MLSRLKSDKFRIHEQNISYYNAIADNYDSLLDRENSNTIVREKVAEKFQHIIPAGEILDFGGGTGRDLKWLMEKGYHILFCEPSEGMKQKAIELNRKTLQYRDLFFLDKGNSDFSNWDTQIPFEKKLDAILANFAVVNCVPDIKLLFKNLSLVLKPGGHFLALILHKKYNKPLLSWLYQEILYLFKRKSTHFQVHFQNHQHRVWIHSIKEIKRISAPYFSFQSEENLTKYGFTLIHLIKK
jgi:SAM-dependent methyltransferase